MSSSFNRDNKLDPRTTIVGSLDLQTDYVKQFFSTMAAVTAGNILTLVILRICFSLWLWQAVASGQVIQ